MIGVRMIRISTPVKTASNAVVNLLSRSLIRNRNRSTRSRWQVRRCQAGSAGAVRGDGATLHLADIQDQ